MYKYRFVERIDGRVEVQRNAIPFLPLFWFNCCHSPFGSDYFNSMVDARNWLKRQLDKEAGEKTKKVHYE